jgi:hypothetical protein
VVTMGSRGGSGAICTTPKAIFHSFLSPSSPKHDFVGSSDPNAYVRVEHRQKFTIALMADWGAANSSARPYLHRFRHATLRCEFLIEAALPMTQVGNLPIIRRYVRICGTH